MATGDRHAGLGRIVALIRAVSILLLLLHCYFYCNNAFITWHLMSKSTDRILSSVRHAGLFTAFEKSKLIALGLLFLSLAGIKGKPAENRGYISGVMYLLLGLSLYFVSALAFKLFDDLITVAVTYMSSTALGYMLVLTGGVKVTRYLAMQGKNQPPCKSEVSFHPEEKLVTNANSLNLPATYELLGTAQNGWINFINPMRGILITGSPGSGKNQYLLERFIKQLVEKGRAVFVFDHKFPDLTTLTYNQFLKNRNKYPPSIKFYSINFDMPAISNRCNPLEPQSLTSLTSAIESSKTLLFSLNRVWVNKQGEYSVESSIHLFAAVIWFLKRFEVGKYCTLPHAIEMIQVDYEKLFSVLRTETETLGLINPFLEAYLNDEKKSLESQLAPLRISLARISAPEFYYILSANDFSLDINNPEQPKIVCLGSSPQRQETLAPVLSLYIDRLNKTISQKGRFPCAQVFDEFATVRATSVLKTIATGRSTEIITVIAVEDYDQLRLMYSKEEAEVIFNITGNIISGRVGGVTARMLSERFARASPPIENRSFRSRHGPVSEAEITVLSIPASKISSLSSNEFVGIVANNPDELIKQKVFRSRIQDFPDWGKREKEDQVPIPTIRQVLPEDIDLVFKRIKQDVHILIASTIGNMLKDPAKEHLVLRKN
jgi:hypothetical protein